MKTFLLILCSVALLTAAYGYISYSHLSPRVQAKRKQLTNALVQAGYKPDYWMISGYRPPWLNRLMPLSAPKSDHQRGLAIDLWVGDVDNDGRWTDADVQIVAKAISKVDSRDPANQGGIGMYHQSAPRMVHFDVSGRRRHWDY
ncbi:DUF882 domain-containing protein [Spirosoma utsteinense]|uniref:DUF882 domain-containing protein n=1 Tax=Spirosoma utsteinense TaxID=2585773 RepID=A0ABR6WDG9_9BACT|nr:DUF882 domain-containing protein [Spirosoma utsteinense]MBC3785664.1 putative protein YcbK (DUF882 family) [Spirosoma utsteinense]MBC3794602.1 putative protein YcbK (DUF882 family) [Spirosoma utsteinense]